MRVVVLAAVLTLGSACSGTAAAPPPAPAPLVADPAPQDQRALSAFEQRPCELLAPAQVASLGLTALSLGNARPATASRPWPCNAIRASTPGGLEPDDVQWSVYSRYDVADDLAKRDIAPLRVVPLTIDGLPSVALENITSFYRCTVGVKTGPGQGVALSVRRDREEIGDTCDYARRVAEEIVRSLPRATA